MTKTPDSFQSRVAPWVHETFGPEISADRLERGDRLLEEVLELLQSGGYPAYRVARLASYVYGRPAGEPAQEVGGVMVTLAAYCLAHELDMHAAGETELARVWTKVEAIRAKQAAKPRGSSLPVPVDVEPDIQPGLKAAIRFIEARRDDYVSEHGFFDPSTGVTEFPGNGDETVGEWEEIIDELQAMADREASEASAHD